MRLLLYLSKALLLFACFVISLNSFGEDKKENKWEIAFAYNSVEAQMDQKLFDTWVYASANYYGYFGDKKDKSYSFSIVPKYRIANDLFLRFEFGITNINLASHYNGIGDTVWQQQGHIATAGDIIKDDNITQKIYRYALGFQSTIISSKFVDAYCGITLNYFNYTKMYWRDNIHDLSFMLPDYKYFDYWSLTPGGFATGVSGLAGVNFHLNKWISFGGEISYALLYYKLGGVEHGVFEIYQYNYSLQEHFNRTLPWQINNNASEGIQFSKVIPSFNLAVSF
jgi:hypothetical protein